MAVVSSLELIGAVEDAIESSGYSGALISPRRERPARFVISGPRLNSTPIWVYIKNLTPAKRSNDDEYRIQLRGANLPLALNPDGPSVLLGYYEAQNLFVGFDPHTVSTGARTQLSGGYVSLRVVKRAKRRGMTFDRDRRNRIAVGLRADMLVSYCLNSDDIHSAAEDTEIIRLLTNAVAQPGRRDAGRFEDAVRTLATERQRLLRTVRTLSRDGRFRSRVLSAYKSTCALCGSQLGLVEAAHILPVSVQGSTDEVGNGIALLPHYHRAFDSGLIYLSRDYVMQVNPDRSAQLERQDLHAGIEELSSELGEISLPRSKRKWPDRAMIRRANAARGIRVG